MRRLPDVFSLAGLPPWWGWLLSLTLVPFVIMLARALYARNDFRESVWLNGAVLGAQAIMVISSLGVAVLFARAAIPPTVGRWAAALGIHLVVWAFLGSGVLFAALQGLSEGVNTRARQYAAGASLVGAALIQLATLYVARTVWPH